MAVGRLSGAWIRQVLTETFPTGILRRDLLDHFAAVLVTRRSSRGAKGRLARRLYGTLLKLQLRGLVTLEGGFIRPAEAAPRAREATPPPPELGPLLRRHLFRAMLAEDGQGDGHSPADLQEARQAFISGALIAGWTLESALSALGIGAPEAAQILADRGPAKKMNSGSVLELNRI